VHFINLWYFCQEESRSISENVTWGQRKRFADGKVSMPYKRFLGYEKGEDGTPKIVESEAEIVRMIYRMFMEGKTFSAIARLLSDSGIPSPGGKKIWQVATVKSILSNEKYKGDALLQKRFTVDFLNKKTKENEGEVPQYYVQNSHPAIIDPAKFDALQIEIERRKKLGRPDTCHSPLSTKLVCGECGGYFGSKVWGSNTKYRKTIWRCNEKYKGNSKCSTPHVTEEEVKDKFMKAFNSILVYRKELIASCLLVQQAICDCTEIDAQIEELQRELDVIYELSRKAIYENAHGSMDLDDFSERNSEYQERYYKTLDQVKMLKEQKHEKQHKSVVLDIFITNIKRQAAALDAFDEQIWMAVIERVIVSAAGQLTFQFKDGTEVCT